MLSLDQKFLRKRSQNDTEFYALTLRSKTNNFGMCLNDLVLLFNCPSLNHFSYEIGILFN